VKGVWCFNKKMHFISALLNRFLYHPKIHAFTITSFIITKHTKALHISPTTGSFPRVYYDVTLHRKAEKCQIYCMYRYYIHFPRMWLIYTYTDKHIELSLLYIIVHLLDILSKNNILSYIMDIKRKNPNKNVIIFKFLSHFFFIDYRV
jgi:hypothetical protein